MMLKLEVGKSYVDREGVMHGPMQAGESREFAFVCRGKMWQGNGSYYIGEESPKDLVAEYAPPQVPGIPEGYRLVRVGTAEYGEWFVNIFGFPERWTTHKQRSGLAIIEPIVPPVPETRKVTVREYLTLKNGEIVAVWSEHPPTECYLGETGSRAEIELPIGEEPYDGCNAEIS